MNENKLKSRYLLATYLVIAGLAAICLLIAFIFTGGIWQSVLINLSTSLLGVVILFFLVNRFFLLDEWQISERIDKLLNRLEIIESPSAEHFFKPISNLETEIDKANSIDWCGVTMEEEIHTHLPKLRDKINAGSNIRILVADPTSRALEMSALRSEGVISERFKKKLDASLEDMEYLHKYWKNAEKSTPKGSLSVRLLPYAPSFGMFNFDGQKHDGAIYIEIFGHADGFGSFPTFKLTLQKDGKWYNFFGKQFEDMWETAIPWQPVSTPLEV